MKWEWKAFSNGARSDKAKLHHWWKKHVNPDEYSFARFNKKPKMIKYTAQEYERNCKSTTWNTVWKLDSFATSLSDPANGNATFSMPVHGSEGRWPPPKPYRGRGTDVEKVEGRAVNGHLDAFVDLPAPAAPANPAMMNRRPRRARPPPGVLLFTPCTVDARGGYSGSGSSVDCGSPPLRVCDLPLLPPPTRGQQKAQWDDQGISPRRARAALDGVEYGPRNTCAVDTFLTLLTHALTADEKRELRRVSSPV